MACGFVMRVKYLSPTPAGVLLPPPQADRPGTPLAYARLTEELRDMNSTLNSAFVVEERIAQATQTKGQWPFRVM
jgi:hypothetical protein